MLYLILIVVTVVLSVIGTYHYNGYFDGECVFAGFISFVISALCCIFLWVGIYCGLSDYSEKRYTCEEVYETYELCALEDNVSTDSNTEGHFFLGCGTIYSTNTTSMKYTYIINTEKGKTMRTQDAEKSYLISCEDSSPKVIIHKSNIYTLKNNNLYKWFFIAKEVVENINESTFYIPNDSIKVDYSIDMR